MQRILIIIASVIVLAGIAVGAYFLFFSGNGASLSIDNPFDGLGGANTDATPNPNNLEPGEELTDAGTVVAQNLIKITDGPVVPQTVSFEIMVPEETLEVASTSTSTPTVTERPDTEIRYIERASGNIYSFVLRERTLTRLSNKTIPGIQEAVWTSDGSRAFVRYLNAQTGTESIDTYSLPANGEGGYFLEQNLSTVDVHGANTLFTLFPNSTGSVGTVAAVDGTGARTLFSSQLSALQFHLASTTYVAATKPSAGLDGYAFLVSPTTGAFNRILGPFKGLSVLPSIQGNEILYSYVSQGTLRLAVVNRTSRTSVTLPLATLAEKCAWASDEASIYCAVPIGVSGTLPDDWYQGATTFTDRIWRIDLAARLAVLVVDPQEVAEVSIDAVGLHVDPAEDSLTFVNRKDGSLWVYDL